MIEAGIKSRYELLGSLIIRRKENLKWYAFLDLRIELTGSPEAQNRVMTSLGLEQGGDLFGRLREVSRNGNVCAAGKRVRGGKESSCGPKGGDEKVIRFH